jgi:hypothetical protein
MVLTDTSVCRTILIHMRGPVLAAEEVDTTATPAVVLDSLIGYSLRGAPRGAAAELIRRWAADDVSGAHRDGTPAARPRAIPSVTQGEGAHGFMTCNPHPGAGTRLFLVRPLTFAADFLGAP